MPRQIILHPRDRLATGFRMAACVDGLLAALVGAVARRDRLERQVRVVEGVVGALVALDLHTTAPRLCRADKFQEGLGQRPAVLEADEQQRTEVRRLGKAGVSTINYRRSPTHYKKNTIDLL